MKFTIFAVCLAACIFATSAAPKFFDFDGFQGVVDTSHQVNGVEGSSIDPKELSKAEEVIKKMIHKHLNKRKQDKKVVRQEKVEKPAPKPSTDPVLPDSINWDDHPEAKERINQRVPGGTEALDALIALAREKQNQN